KIPAARSRTEEIVPIQPEVYQCVATDDAERLHVIRRLERALVRDGRAEGELSGQAANRQSVELIETDLVAGNELEAVGREVLSDGSDVVLVIGVEIRIGQRQLNGFRRNQGLLQLGALNDGGSGVVGQLQLRRNAVDIDKGVDVSLRVAVVGAKHVEVRAHRHPAKLGVRLDSQLDVARLLGPVGEIGIVLRYGRIETAGLVAFAR